MRSGERGISLVEVLVAAGIVAMLAVVVVTALHTAFFAVKTTNGKVADAVHAVASDARAAIAYDGATAKFQNATWTDTTGVKITTIVGPSTLMIVGMLAQGNVTYQETIPLTQEAVDPYAGYIQAH